MKSRIVTWHRHRKTAMELHAMSDRDLHDIGISRHDIERIAKLAARRG